MAEFYMSREMDSKGNHVVHCEGCDLMPEPEEIIHLGNFDVCMLAVAKAKGMGYKHVNGCHKCNRPCHFEGYVDS